MHRTSELIQRNAHRIEAGNALLVNPPDGGVVRTLARQGVSVRCFSQSFRTCRALQAEGIEVEFGALPSADEAADLVIVFMPREKARLRLLLHAVAAALDDTGVLWLVGENRSGIKSSPCHVGEWFGKVGKLDAARHCVIMEAHEPASVEEPDLDKWTQQWSVEFDGGFLPMASLPGVFAQGRLDPGTRCLLEQLPTLHSGQRLLDFGCGAGVLGICANRRQPGLDVTMLDDDALAIESARRSAKLNDGTPHLVASDGFSALDPEQDRFHWIVSNPPFHRGSATDYTVVEQFITRAGRHLLPNGNIMLVANRHLPYERLLHAAFGKVRTMAESGGFKVLLAHR